MRDMKDMSKPTKGRLGPDRFQKTYSQTRLGPIPTFQGEQLTMFILRKKL